MQESRKRLCFANGSGRKVGSLKQPVRDEKLHAVVSMSRSIKHLSFGALFEIEMSKKCTLPWHKAHVHLKMHKTHQPRTTFQIETSKKCTPLWREAHFQVKMSKTSQLRTTFGS